MQAGILYGYVGQVEGIVKRMKEQSKVEAESYCNRWISNINCTRIKYY